MSALKLLGIFIGLFFGMFCVEIIFWQFLKFGSLLGIFVSIFVALAIFIAMTWLDIDGKEESPEAHKAIPDWGLWLLPSFSGFYIFISAPFWDSGGYCFQQTRSFLGNNKFVESTDVAVLADQSICLRDPIGYMSIIEWIILLPITLAILAPCCFLICKWLAAYIVKNWILKESKSEIPSVSVIIDDLRKQLEAKTYRENESEIFYFRFPEDRMNECTEKEKELIIEYYHVLIEDLPNVYTKEVERKTLVSRIESITKKIKDAQEAIDKLKTYKN